MVQEFNNYIFKYLIENKGYLPVQNQDGSFLLSENIMILHNRKYNLDIFVEILNCDAYSPSEIENKMNHNRNFLMSNSKGNNFSFFMIFVTDGCIDEEKLNIISSSGVNKSLTFDVSPFIVNLSEKKAIKLFNYPKNTYDLEKILDKAVTSNNYLNTDFSGIHELVNKKSEEYKISFVTNRPIATYILAGINILIFLILYYVAKKNSFDSDSFSKQYHFLLYSYGSKVNSLISSGEIWRLITACFLHSDKSHIVMNSMSLILIGPIMEKMLGTKKFIIVYFIAGLMGSVVSYMFTDSNSVGASGAIMGVLGAMIYFALENPVQFKRYFASTIISIFLINVPFALTNRNIDNFGHIGGLIGGFLAAASVGFSPKGNKYFNRQAAIIFIIISIAGGLIWGYFRNT